jgi:hypothetical protein
MAIDEALTRLDLNKIEKKCPFEYVFGQKNFDSGKKIKYSVVIHKFLVTHKDFVLTRAF